MARLDKERYEAVSPLLDRALELTEQDRAKWLESLHTLSPTLALDLEALLEQRGIVREEGFLEAVKKHPGLEVVSDNQYAGPTTESAYSASESLLLAKKASAGGISGVFAPNESTTFGMLLALEKASLAGKVKFVGFDASDKLVQAVRAGQIDALVLQNPFNMGYLSVKAMVSHLRGTKVEARTDTGAQLVDKANLEQPEIRELVKPDLAKWLGQ